MKWSWKIARVAGIDVFMHATFLLLLAWVGISYYSAGGLSYAIDGLFFIALLFGIVVLHELGHALTARRFGIATRDITLLPIGGLARLERMPEDPKQELLVALAGPAVNVALAVLILFLAVPVHLTNLDGLSLVGSELFLKLFWVNIGLAVFNMLPAFPMDGGRVLRALLAIKMDYVRATEIAANVGQALAILFGFIGLFTNPFLVFIALFVWMGAGQEASIVEMKAALRGVPISHLMITDFRILHPWEPLSRVVQLILSGWQQDFPVVNEDRVVGILTRSALLTALSGAESDQRVQDVMLSRFETADASEMAQPVFTRLQACDCRTLPVLQGGKLVGLVTAENLGEFLMIEKARPGASE